VEPCPERAGRRERNRPSRGGDAVRSRARTGGDGPETESDHSKAGRCSGSRARTGGTAETESTIKRRSVRMSASGVAASRLVPRGARARRPAPVGWSSARDHDVDVSRRSAAMVRVEESGPRTSAHELGLLLPPAPSGPSIGLQDAGGGGSARAGGAPIHRRSSAVGQAYAVVRRPRTGPNPSTMYAPPYAFRSTTQMAAARWRRRTRAGSCAPVGG